MNSIRHGLVTALLMPLTVVMLVPIALATLALVVFVEPKRARGRRA